MPISNNLLLAVRTKRTIRVDVKAPVLKYVIKTYGSTVAQDAEDDLDVMQELRNEIVGACALPDRWVTIETTARSACWNRISLPCFSHAFFLLFNLCAHCHDRTCS